MKLTKKEQDKLNKQLFTAISRDDLEGVKTAVAASVDVNWQNEYGNTPLFRSTKYFVDIKIMEFLLEHGADPDLQNFRLPL